MPLRTPPRHFVEELRNIHPGLEVRWSDHLNRWLLGQRDKDVKSEFPDQPWDFHVLRIIETKGKEYRDLDQRVLDDVIWGDPYRRPGGARDIIDEIQELNNKKYENEERRAEDLSVHMGEMIARRIRQVETVGFGKSRTGIMR